MSATPKPAAVTPPGGKQPFNRKLAILLIAAIGVLGMFAVLFMRAKDPQRMAEERKQKEQQEQLARQPEGSLDAGQAEVQRAAAEIEKKKRDAELARQRDELAAAFGGDVKGGIPPIDPVLLRQLDEAQREVGRAPDVRRGFTGQTQAPGIGVGGATTARPNEGIVYDRYDRASKGVVPETADALFGEQDRSARTFDTIRPQRPPSARVLTQGTGIPVVLTSRIDTRVAGPATAMVARDVYDSRTQQILLIPKGSRLVGKYETSVTPGIDRISLAFERLILPDGRALALPGFESAGLDGTIGVVGRYKSNLAKAIGPALFVAVLGQAVDRKINQQIPADSGTVVTPTGTVAQAPSVIQQVMPAINQQVMQRYAGAKPYFLVEPGQMLRVVLSADIEIPVLKEGK
jgi:type IV secretory pathway VirB10-like protein